MRSFSWVKVPTYQPKYLFLWVKCSDIFAHANDSFFCKDIVSSEPRNSILVGLGEFVGYDVVCATNSAFDDVFCLPIEIC